MNFDNLEEAIPNIPIHVHNCLIRNSITDYEKLADMTDYDISRLKYGCDFKEMLNYRDKARYYRDFRKELNYES